jgi:hypothetical protein
MATICGEVRILLYLMDRPRLDLLPSQVLDRVSATKMEMGFIHVRGLSFLGNNARDGKY